MPPPTKTKSMKAAYIYNNKLATKIKIGFFITAADLEFATIAVWVKGKKATIKNIKEEIGDMFRSGGADGCHDWVDESHIEEYGKMAIDHCQKLFPSFYQKQKAC